MSYEKTTPYEKEDRLNLYTRWHDQAKLYFLWQMEQFKPYLGDYIVDIGCGLGNFTEILLEKKYVGIDSDRRMVEAMKVKYAKRKNVEFFQADVTCQEQMDFLKDRHPDSILCVNVLEHIEKDMIALNNMLAVLPPDGHLCLLVPAFQFLFGTLDSMDDHFRRYDKRLLSDMLKDLPGKVVCQYYFNLVGGLGWFLKGRILREKTQSDLNYKVMTLLIPLLSKMERVFRPPFGISLIVIIKK